MIKVSLWKRVGGWLRRAPEPVEGGEAIQLDPEGLVVEERKGADEPVLAVTARSRKGDPQLAALEDGFGRLVQVLQSIDENAAQQRQQAGEMSGQLRALREVLAGLPGGAEQQAALKELAQELRGQAMRQQQVAEVVRRLPELTQSQLDKLGEIGRQLEASSETQVQAVESFNRFDRTVQGVLGQAGEQTAALRQMQAVSAQSGQQLAELIRRQNRRLLWFFVGVVVLGAAVLAAAAVLWARRWGGG